MLQNFSLAGWASWGRGLLVGFLAGAIGACDSTERLTSPADPTGGAAQASPAPPRAPSFSSTSLPGISFGTFNQPMDQFGDTYNGAVLAIGPGELLRNLAAIKAHGGRVVLNLAGGQSNFTDADGHFSVSMWKSRLDRFKGVNFSSYVADGTIVANRLLDEPNDPTNWNGIPVTPETVEQLAAYSKQLWPDLLTAIRVDPSYLAGGTYHYLDAAWAQYVVRKGDVNDYVARRVADAKKVGLGLIVGLNVTKGGLGGVELTPSELTTYGSTLLADPYPCAFLMWDYSATYLAKPGVTAAMNGLSNLAQQHVSRTCRGTNTGGTLPPPNNPPVAAFDIPSCTAGDPCQFTNKSSDSDGSIASVSWDFGDGSTSTALNPVHTFSSANTYTVTLRVTDNGGTSRSIAPSVTVTSRANQPPNASFTAPSCTVNVACDFKDGSTDPDGTIAQYLWTFAPGATATVANPSNTFTTTGSYGVTLKVTDNAGAIATTTQTVTVKASNVAPVAAFVAPKCTAGAPCQFTDGSHDSDGTLASRSWSFGTGSPSTDANPTFTYPAAGTYSVTLSVTDNDGASNSVTQDVVVGVATLPGSTPIALKIVPVIIDGTSKLKLTWTGATGATVDVYRNGEFRATIANTGKMIRAPTGFTETAYLYQICDTGTARCSNTVSTATGSSNPPPPPPPSIQLSTTIQTQPIAGIVLNWTGATGANVDVYRDGVLFKTVPNSGTQLNSKGVVAGSTYTYRVCEQGTTNCSNTATITMGSSNPPPTTPSIQLSTALQAQPIAGIVLNWTGATGANVDLYRNGVLFKTVPNSGTQLNSKGVVTGSTYTYRVCEQGSSTCSTTMTATMQ